MRGDWRRPRVQVVQGDLRDRTVHYQNVGKLVQRREQIDGKLQQGEWMRYPQQSPASEERVGLDMQREVQQTSLR